VSFIRKGWRFILANPFFFKSDMKKITIYEYYANNCPSDAYDLLSKEGNYKRPNSPEELEGQLKDYVNKNGERGLLKLAEIHPDKELVTMVCDCKKSKSVEKKENFSNANGNSNISDSQAEQISLAKMMIFGGFILVGIALIMKK
jgi:hypothetical protein